MTPWIISRDTARLIAFTMEGFGVQDLGRMPGPDGSIGHAEVRIGDSVVMMFDARDGWPDTPAFWRLYVDRVGRVRDPLGNIWWLQAHAVDTVPAQTAAPARSCQHLTSRGRWRAGSPAGTGPAPTTLVWLDPVAQAGVLPHSGGRIAGAEVFTAQ